MVWGGGGRGGGGRGAALQFYFFFFKGSHGNDGTDCQVRQPDACSLCCSPHLAVTRGRFLNVITFE